MKKILLLADVNSPHTQKWASGLAAAGFKTGVFSLAAPESDWFSNEGIKVFHEKLFEKKLFGLSAILKIEYLYSLKHLKNVVKDFHPDILHAHYATSYGGLGRLTGFHPLLISVWGSDVLDFPKKTFLHKWFLQKNLLAADQLLVTSKVLQEEVSGLIHKNSVIIPFGIDVNVFRPTGERKYFDADAIVVGTIKTLEKHYCIDILITAFAKTSLKYAALKLRLLIVGGGSESDHLKMLAGKLGLKDTVHFTGKVPYDQVRDYHNTIDIFANLSAYESFGVSVLEASACSKPVVASDTGGLREVVVRDKTGFLVPVKNADAAAAAIEKLILDKQLRETMGAEGRKYVLEKYDWEKCFQQMTSMYASF